MKKSRNRFAQAVYRDLINWIEGSSPPEAPLTAAKIVKGLKRDLGVVVTARRVEAYCKRHNLPILSSRRRRATAPRVCDVTVAFLESRVRRLRDGGYSVPEVVLDDLRKLTAYYTRSGGQLPQVVIRRKTSPSVGGSSAPPSGSGLQPSMGTSA